MEITEVKVFPVSEEKLKAFVSIVLDCCFMVNDIKVIRGKDGLFISMPSRKKKNGEFKDVAHPLNNETRRMIEVHVLEEYERVLRERGEAPEAGRRLLKIDDERGPARPAAVPAPGPVEDGEAERPAAAAAAAATPEPKEEDSTEGKSLEEIQEMHLRDSFWSVS
jgi:stage V sporulation protein G